MRRPLFFLIPLVLVGVGLIRADSNTAASAIQTRRISVRTENYPRPPYSGATYYIYERDGQVICTKLRVCNKYDDCAVEYKSGTYKEDIDIETGEPYRKTDAVFIPASKLRKHACLTKFKLLPR